MEFFSEIQVFIVDLGISHSTFRDSPTKIGILHYETGNQINRE
jgi:hypothetical protein